MNIALIYLKWKNLDSALLYARQAYDIESHFPPEEQAAHSAVAATLANVFEEKGDYVNARKIYGIALDTMKKFDAPLLKVRLFNNIARFFLKTGDTDSSIYFSKTGLALCRNGQFGEHALDAANLLAQTYETLKIPDSALKYMKIGRAIKDTIFSQQRLQQFQLLNFSEGQRQKDIEAAKEKLRNQLRFYGLLGAAVTLLLLTLILYRNNRNKQRANKMLESQKMEIDQQRAVAERALHELKATQSQLIQSEKMASLGEMTAGIAHEIQNPLNFVNNFSEVNSELLDEMNKAWEEGNAKEARALSEGIKQNLEKINHHGKRADAIVKRNAAALQDQPGPQRVRRPQCHGGRISPVKLPRHAGERQILQCKIQHFIG